MIRQTKSYKAACIWNIQSDELIKQPKLVDYIYLDDNDQKPIQ